MQRTQKRQEIRRNEWEQKRSTKRRGKGGGTRILPMEMKIWTAFVGSLLFTELEVKQTKSERRQHK